MCANEQDKFWEMHSILFANLGAENQGGLSERRLQAMAESIGLDMNAYNSCFSANKYEAEIQADFDLGEEMGVSGTPTIFVRGPGWCRDRCFLSGDRTGGQRASGE
jgi:protein-disulfide isomerase